LLPCRHARSDPTRRRDRHRSILAAPAAGRRCRVRSRRACGSGRPGPCRRLSLLWDIPFVGLLLSIALWPLVAPQFWHSHFGKIALAWTAVLVVPFAVRYGASETLRNVVHALLLEYLPFLIILFALYTIAGGICVRGRTGGTPARNTALLALGSVLASIMGTTGASMLLIRPLLASNATRAHQVHTVVFFIVLVGNIGGGLSPLGDPPLFIGFLKGVDFFWPTRALALPSSIMCGLLLATFYVVDHVLYRREAVTRVPVADPGPLRIEGGFNLLLLAAVIAAVLLSGLWDPGIVFDVHGSRVELQNLVRDLILVGLALLSLKLTPSAVREHNVFHWAPIVEVAKLFAAIFVTIFPVIAILQAGRAGALAPVVALVTGAEGEPVNVMYFWMTGLLSAVLDNAPTYLVFFNLASGDAEVLMGPLAATLRAISMGAVYFGALTYVGNAPNFMIKAIAEDRGIAMPSFFGYMLWSVPLMLPLLLLLALKIV
jgi:Na+/H+ antiporter NhaD/arsenite permease-like protein